MAERFYRQALALKQQPEIWVLLSSALGHLGKNDEAISRMESRPAFRELTTNTNRVPIFAFIEKLNSSLEDFLNFLHC